MLVAWSMAALALLSKGLVAIALPGLTLIAYSACTRQWSVWQRLHWAPGVALFLAIGAPWFIAIALANPEFPQFFFLQEHAQRFLTQMHRRVEPWWYFLPFLLGGALPWATLAVPAMFRSWRANKSRPASSVDSLLFLTLWIVIIVAFFSLSQSKLAPYILPTMPALALVTAHYASRITADSLLPHLYAIACIYGLAILYLALAPIPQRNGLSPETVSNIFEAGRVAFSIALTGAIIGIVLAYREQVSAALLALSAGSFLCISTLLFAADEIKGIRSGRELAATITPFVARDKPLYSLAQYDHTLTFYLQKPTTLVGYRGELDFGLRQEPNRWLPDEQTFKSAWARDPTGTIALMPHEIYQRFVREQLPMLPIGQNTKVMAVMKPAAPQ
jgi:4-amino-4-deoxy-L-arabinose transferase-like glycosyltransferase